MNEDATVWAELLETLPERELWKLYPSYPEKFCFFDIETTGLKGGDRITLVSFFRQNQMHTFVRGINLEMALDNWEQDLVLVSYNGRRFDQPFLEKEFGFRFENKHLDLMEVLHKMQIKGGLKASEEQLGLKREIALQGVDGYMATLLWKEYVETDRKEVLNLLIRYNQADTQQLVLVLEKILERKKNLAQ